MQCFLTPSIARMNIRTRCKKIVHDLGLIRCRRNMQGGIPRVDISSYSIEKEWHCRLSGRSRLKAHSRQMRRCRKKTRNAFSITGNNNSDHLMECKIGFDHSRMASSRK
jgi:hypothetical protein